MVELDSAAAYRRVRNWIRLWIGSADQASDLTQEVFLRAHRAAIQEQLPPERQLSWLFRVARNLALNHRRDASRRPEHIVDHYPTCAARQERRLLLRQTLSAVRPGDRRLFLLRQGVGLSCQEIARATGVPERTVRHREYRIRCRLRAVLSETLRVWMLLSLLPTALGVA